MDSQMRQQAVRDHVRKKFKGRHTLEIKVPPMYPESVEREYQRVTNAYMRLLSKLVSESMVPKIRTLAKTELPPNYYRKDDERDFWSRLNEMFEELEKELIRASGAFALHRRISAIASLEVKLSIKAWKKAVQETIGIDLLEDYYNGDFFRRALEEWTRDNVDLIKTIPHDTLGKMREIVLDGYRNSRTTTDIVKDIQKAYGVSRRHAQLIARDQIGKLHSEVVRKQHEDAGVKEYIWRTTGDRLVRDGHRKLNGKKFRWDDPPVVDERTGRRCHPGQDYQCRCTAKAVLNIDTLDL